MFNSIFGGICADLTWTTEEGGRRLKKRKKTSKCAHVCEIVHLSVHYWNAYNAKNEYSLENGNFSFKYTLKHTLPKFIYEEKKHLSRRRFAINYNGKWIYSNETIRLFYSFFYSFLFCLRLHTPPSPVCSFVHHLCFMSSPRGWH